MWGAAVRTWSAVVKSVHVCLVVWLGKEVCCSSSRCTTHGLQEQYVEVAPHAAGRSWALGLDSD